MSYKAYPNVRDTPSRKIRKSSRLSVFQHNKTFARKAKREAQRERKAGQE